MWTNIQYVFRLIECHAYLHLHTHCSTFMTMHSKIKQYKVHLFEFDPPVQKVQFLNFLMSFRTFQCFWSVSATGNRTGWSPHTFSTTKQTKFEKNIQNGRPKKSFDLQILRSWLARPCGLQATLRPNVCKTSQNVPKRCKTIQNLTASTSSINYSFIRYY